MRDGRDAWPMDLAEVPLDGKLIELDCAIQLRLDQVLCAALSCVATCASFELERRFALPRHGAGTLSSLEALPTLGLLLGFESLLSTQGAELAMLGDFVRFGVFSFARGRPRTDP